jgi:hypothetical protein
MRIFSTFIIDRRRELTVRAFDSRPVSCLAVKRCLTPYGDEKMPCANMVGHFQVVLPVPTPVSLRWRAFITTFAAVQDAFQEALEMRQAAHKERRLNDE